MSAVIGSNKAVSLHYTLKDDSGEVLDSSRDADPMVYLHGAGNIVVGLETALAGKAAGEKLEVVVPASDGYGEKEGPGPQAVPKAAFGDNSVEAGMSLMVEDEDGNHTPLWVVEVREQEVLVDTNHPLAGQTLHFEVEVLEVRDATEQELAHGHIHAGGHNH